MTEADDYKIKFMEKDELEIILPDILNFDNEIFQEHAYDIIGWFDIIQKYQYAITIYHDETLVGIIVTVDNKNMFNLDDLIGNSLSYIVTIGIHKNHRKKGLGSLLLEHLDKKLVATPACYNIILDVDKDNDNAINLYTKNGYKIIKDLDEYQYIMTKNLVYNYSDNYSV